MLRRKKVNGLSILDLDIDLTREPNRTWTKEFESILSPVYKYPNIFCKLVFHIICIIRTQNILDIWKKKTLKLKNWTMPGSSTQDGKDYMCIVI